MNFDELVESRRSVRKYKEAKIPSEKILLAVEFAKDNSPSWKNSQTHRYFLAFSKEKIAQVVSALPERNQLKCKNAVAFIVSGFEKNISGFSNGIADNELGNEWGAYDLGLSDSLLILKARELGLDTLIMGLRNSDELRKIFNIPQNIEVCSVISVGIREENVIPKPGRKSSEEIISVF